ncbi:MAG: TatD family nuclease-associated radical SAM protein [Dictyoglomaceae bacterium]|nr:TatD family nuclease-associated radical SAM protein [Dictyoglomaceae bacterium]
MNTVYLLGENLYLNITNQCTNRCVFCIKNFSSGVGNKILWLEREPTYKEIVEELKSYFPLKKYKEIVFCGFGEPLLRINILKKISEFIKANDSSIILRIDTNGQGNVFHQRNILLELRDWIDSISISLNAESSEKYNKICRPVFKNVYEEILEFIKLATKFIKNVQITIVDLPEIDKYLCEKIALELGVKFHIRKFIKTL